MEQGASLITSVSPFHCTTLVLLKCTTRTHSRGFCVRVVISKLNGTGWCVFLYNRTCDTAITPCLQIQGRNSSETSEISYLTFIWGPFEKFLDSTITPSWNFVEVRWRSLFQSTSLGKQCTSYNATPTSRKHAADHSSLRNFLPRSSLFMVGKAQKSHGARSELNTVFGLEKVDRWNPIRTSAIQFRSRLMRFLGFSNHEKGAPRQGISKWSTVCSTFSRSRWSVVRSASLAKGGTSEKRPSPHLRQVPTRSNKVSPRIFQTAPVWSSSLCHFLHPPFTFSLLGPNIPISTLCSDPLNLFFP
jgi:hypothetical protein